MKLSYSLFFQNRIRLINILALALIYTFIADRYPLRLLITDTILTGGDSASWYQIALHMRDELLPSGKLFGWTMDNYFGYKNLLHYFVFPFFCIAILGSIIPLTIALKVVSFVGVLVTPMAVFWTLRRLNYTHLIPLIGAAASSYFLFHEHFSMFGGNLLSTLAGEFSFSIAFALFIVYIGMFLFGIKHQRNVIGNGILLALIGLSHAFVFFSALLLPGYCLLTKNRFKENLVYIALVFLIAFLLMAFWTLPMLADRAYTSPITMIWNFQSTRHFTNQLGIFTIVMTMIAVLLAFYKRIRTPYTMFYVYMICTSIFLYLIATSLKIPDIRFFPVWIFFSILLFIDILSIFLKKTENASQLKTVSVVIAIAFTGTIIYSPQQESPEWFYWNYSGYESKPAFQNETHKRIVSTLKGDPSLGRIAFEHTSYTNEFGSDRVFENLPMFTGRPTTEGIHYASGYLSKTISALNGEFSMSSGGAEPIVNSHPDARRLRQHFRLFNISQLIVKTEHIKEMLQNSPDFRNIETIGDYSIFELTDYQPRYVEPLDHWPALVDVRSRDSTTAIRHWYRRSGDINEVFVDKKDVKIEFQSTFFSKSTGQLSAVGKLNINNPAKLEKKQVEHESINNNLIQFHTKSTGLPHLIKVAFSPDWKSLNGEPIFRIAPGMMLIFPESQDVTLVHTRNWTEYLGIFLTILGIIFILWLNMSRKDLLKLLTNSASLEFLTSLLLRLRTLLVIGIITMISTLAIFAYSEKQRINFTYDQANALKDAGQLEQAIKQYRKIIASEIIEEYDRDEIPHAFLSIAQAYNQLGEHEEAYNYLTKLQQAFPSWKLMDQVNEMLAEYEIDNQNFTRAKQHISECLIVSQYTGRNRSCIRLLERLNTETKPIGNG